MLINIGFKEGALEKIMESNAKSRASYPLLARLSKSFDKPGMRVLDVGIHGDVWPGGHLFLFKEAEYETVDIDPHVQPTHVADIRDLPFENESYDLVICHSVIEHVLERRWEAYGELFRILKPGGAVLYVIPEMIDSREVEPAKYVSKTVLRNFYEGKDYEMDSLGDGSFYMEVRK